MFGPSGLFFFQRKKHDALRNIRPYVDDNILPQTCAYTEKAELWRAVQCQRDAYIHTRQYNT